MVDGAGAGVGGLEFTYVLIPADEDQPVQELSAAAAPCGDTLKELLKAAFAGGELTNLDELRAQYGAIVDQKRKDFEKVAQRGSVEAIALVRQSATTLPLPHHATFLYFDEMGCLKERPANRRAQELARQCGLDMEHPPPGDVFVGRVCCDPGPVSASITKGELDSDAPWIRQAPAENAAWKGALAEFGDIAKSKAVGAKTAEEEEAENVQRGWRWSQTESDVEVTVDLPEGVSKSSLAVAIGRTTLRVTVKGEQTRALVDLRLFAPVSPEESTWTLGSDERGGHAQVTLAKEEEVSWPLIEPKGR